MVRPVGVFMTPSGFFQLNLNLYSMKTSIIQSIIDGRAMQDMAKEHNVTPNYFTQYLKAEMKQVANHPLNDELDLSAQNAFAIRRNPRVWSLAIANAQVDPKITGTKLSPVQHIITADSISDAFDMALKHDSITKKDAMILVYNTTLKLCNV